MTSNKSTAATMKAKGNALMKEEKFVEAIIQYSEGIAMEPANPVLYSNRSLAFLKMDQHFFAVKDAEITIRLTPEWPKGYYRKGQAEMAAEMFHLAVKSFESGLKVCPNDEILKNALNEANVRQKKYQDWKRWTIKKYTIIFGVLGSLLTMVDLLWDQESSFIKKPWQRGLIVTCSAVLGYMLVTLVLSVHRNTKASLLQPPPELLQGTDPEYHPVQGLKPSHGAAADENPVPKPKNE